MADDLSLINERLLPPQMRELVRVIGLAETIALLDARHGLPTTLPTHIESKTALRNVISDTAIAALVASPLAGKYYRDLPTSGKPFKQLRNAAIAAADESLSTLARQNNLTRRHIINLRKIRIPARQQVDLFDDSNVG